MHLVLDISLSVLKPWLPQPAGIERVEFAHTRHWRKLPARDITFVMRNKWDRFAMVPDGLARDILADVDAKVAPGMRDNRLPLKLKPALVRLRHLFRLGHAELEHRIMARPDSVFLTVSLATLHMQPCLRALRRLGCRVVPLIHDTLPLTHPQYFLPHHAPYHAMRMEALATMAEAALVVSAGARDDLALYFQRNNLTLPPTRVAHLGLDLPRFAAPGMGTRGTAEKPYFLMLGSLEPRKNHLLMLQLWQTLKHRPDAPQLRIIGKRPGEPDTTTMTLDRADFGGAVQELGRVPDAEAAAVLAGAKALLFPSIWEGFGIPLAEALAMGVPVIASDIPVFHEIGGDVPEFLDPLDGPGWRQAILDYAEAGSLRRAAQLRRLEGWHAPSWAAHFAVAEALLHEVAAAPPRER